MSHHVCIVKALHRVPLTRMAEIVSYRTGSVCGGEVMEQHFNSYEEFWDFYVSEHKNPTNRALHFVGLTAAMLTVLRRKPRWMIRGLLWGYGLAWIGHFFVEKNKPASFKNPLWSLRSDFRMWFKILTRTMAAEVERVQAQQSAAPVENVN